MNRLSHITINAAVYLLAFLNMSDAFAQPTITHEDNAPHPGDSLTLIMLESIDAGNSGKDVVWDFSELAPAGTITNSEFISGPDSTMLYMNGTHTYHMLQSGDSLLLICQESPYTYTEFDSPLVLMTYPFEYGYCMEQSYTSNGRYCETMLTDSRGSMYVEADATGTLIMPDSTKADNAIRIHVTRTESIRMMPIDGPATTTEEPDMSRMEIEEMFLWFADGYRHPLYMTRTVTGYSDLVPVGSVRTACRIGFDFIPYKEGAENVCDSLRIHEGSSLLTCSLNVYRSTAVLTYCTTRDADISILLCSGTGVIYTRRTLYAHAGENGSVTFDCSSLVNGNYVVYVNAGGETHSEKFNIKR